MGAAPRRTRSPQANLFSSIFDAPVWMCFSGSTQVCALLCCFLLTGKRVNTKGFSHGASSELSHLCRQLPHVDGLRCGDSTLTECGGLGETTCLEGWHYQSSSQPWRRDDKFCAWEHVSLRQQFTGASMAISPSILIGTKAHVAPGVNIVRAESWVATCRACTRPFQGRACLRSAAASRGGAARASCVAWLGRALPSAGLRMVFAWLLHDSLRAPLLLCWWPGSMFLFSGQRAWCTVASFRFSFFRPACFVYGCQFSFFRPACLVHGAYCKNIISSSTDEPT